MMMIALCFYVLEEINQEEDEMSEDIRCRTNIKERFLFN